MATKKKARKKKAAIVRKPTHRTLSIGKLTKGYHACTGATIQFANLFWSLTNVAVSESAIRGRPTDRFTAERVGRLIGGQSWILSKDGQDRFLRAARAKHVLYPETDYDRREHLALMARYYAAFPKRASYAR